MTKPPDRSSPLGAVLSCVLCGHGPKSHFINDYACADCPCDEFRMWGSYNDVRATIALIPRLVSLPAWIHADDRRWVAAAITEREGGGCVDAPMVEA